MTVAAGAYRGAPKLASETMVALLARLLKRGYGVKRAAREFHRLTGVRISHQTADSYRRRFGLAPLRLRSVPIPCDLCGRSAVGRRFEGAPWGLEGHICERCRSELVAESLAARRAAARRERDFQARAVRCRVEAGSLRPGVILNRRFRTSDLRGRALTHWLKAVLARGDAAAVLTAEEEE